MTFDTNGGSYIASQTVESGKYATRPTDPTRSGYTFKGWTLNGKAYDFSQPVTSNITLVAQWTKNAPAKPSAPATVKAAVSGSNIKITWSKVSGATKYALYRREYDAATKTWGPKEKVSAKLTGTSYTDKNVEPGVYYAYYVRAYNSAWSGYSKTAKAKAPVQKPAAPINLNATVAKGSIKITWSKVGGATKYAIYRNVYDDTSKTWNGWELVSNKLTAASYTDKTVQAGTIYAYRVRAYNGAWSGYSANVKATAK